MSDDPMPVFIVKAKDNLAPRAIAAYVNSLYDNGLSVQATYAMAALQEVVAWRERNEHLCKWPDHKHVPAGQAGSGSEPRLQDGGADCECRARYGADRDGTFPARAMCPLATECARRERLVQDGGE